MTTIGRCAGCVPGLVKAGNQDGVASPAGGVASSGPTNMNAAVAEGQPTTKSECATNAPKTWTAGEIESLEWDYKYGTMDMRNGRRLYFHRNKATGVWRLEIKHDGNRTENRYSLVIWPEPTWADASTIAKGINDAAQ